jgi:hypothetical protein
MTFERRLVVGLEEIKAIVFECNECKSRVAISPQSIEHPPHSCPRSHSWNWDRPAERSMMASAHQDFISGLKALRDPAREHSSGFKIFLEYEEPGQPSK